MDAIRHKACPNPACTDVGKLGAGNIVRHASYYTKSGPRQRCLCKTCGRTFSANTGTAWATVQRVLSSSLLRLDSCEASRSSEERAAEVYLKYLEQRSDEEGRQPLQTVPLGSYLRARFTEALLWS